MEGKLSEYNFRYPEYVYQLDLSSQVILAIVYGLFAFFVIRWEKLVKEKRWVVYTISIVIIAAIEIYDIVNIYVATIAEKGPLET